MAPPQFTSRVNLKTVVTSDGDCALPGDGIAAASKSAAPQRSRRSCKNRVCNLRSTTADKSVLTVARLILTVQFKEGLCAMEEIGALHTGARALPLVGAFGTPV